jgi:hypothetical protein
LHYSPNHQTVSIGFLTGFELQEKPFQHQTSHQLR